MKDRFKKMVGGRKEGGKLEKKMKGGEGDNSRKIIRNDRFKKELGGKGGGEGKDGRRRRN